MKKRINNFSRKITEEPNLPASHAMLYATGLKETDFCKAQIGIVSNWYEGNPCNMHLNQLGKKIKSSIINKNLIGFQFTTIGVSDGITMGTYGMRYSLPSRELIADSIETVVDSHHYDGVIAIPGCDKNLPGVMMALLRLNRPSIIVYGGSISSGYYNEKKLDIVSSFEALGKKNTCKISEKEYKDIVKNSCPGPGACGGMYTANTMASALEAMGMTLPYSSSSPSTSENKKIECEEVSIFIKKLLEKNIKPKDIVTKTSIENGVKLAMCLGGSTNLVLHFLAIAKSANINFTLKDFQKISNQVPLLGNLKPSGVFLMEDIHMYIGGMPVIIKYLLNEGILSGDCITVTGETLSENMKNVPNMTFNQKIIYSLKKPIKKDGHIRILYGNISPEGSIAKITGKEGIIFRGKANVFNSEEEANQAILNHQIHHGDVVVIRYVGPIGGPGMPEMLKPTSYIMGSGLGKNVALITDGRFSGGSHGFVVGHITPEAQSGGPIALIKNGDFIKIDAENNTLTLEVEDEEIKRRKKIWTPPVLKVKRGYLYKYIKTVSPASEGCITDQF
ncbi:Dihydroxy-acid dehydratase [Blattabacterium sp. (Periplaneta americana) str. BPLAN]|uniref:dihydroxy-acid dehydratase n=1 Tax=Blattabacterium sp. (Periplaneta americana) TaxID=367488 RepID=UPI0001BA0B4C|nr:dihydroxy-acid dehydratase [Blattabacterium sp. (Periplaneta americana)]ACX83718.1 Dihydroxy-acid dehydratase [Blattabacterium sp. (Periplaneta americana) str. BPLAN]